MLLPEVMLTCGPDPPAATEVLVRGHMDVSATTLGAMPALAAFIIPFAGPPPSQQEALRTEQQRRQVAGLPALRLLNAHHNAPLTAEMAIALLLSSSKRLLPADAALRRGDWTPRGLPLKGGPVAPTPMPAITLEGKRALVLGLGAVGSRCAAMLATMGMEVHAITRSAPRTGGTDGTRRRLPSGAEVRLHPPDALLAQLPLTTALLVCLPGTRDTTGLIGRDQLAALPAGRAVVVNVARGSCVDAGAVRAALESGHLFGYASDVWWKYPEAWSEVDSTLPWGSPAESLAPLEHCTVLSPHRGGGVGLEETEQRRWRGLATALNAAARRGGALEALEVEPLGRFSLELGY